MIILQDINSNKTVGYESFDDITFFTSREQSYGVCAFATTSNCVGIVLSALICFIIVIKKLLSDPLFTFLFCYFASELIHGLAYMVSIIISCYGNITINKHICTAIEICLLCSGITSVIWLSLNAIVRAVYFVYPFKYFRYVTERNSLICIITTFIWALFCVVLMGGYTYRRPTFTNDCKEGNNISGYSMLIFILLLVCMCIQIYCPYRIWRLMKSQIASQNALCLPANITEAMSISKRKTFQMLLFISGGFWIFYIPTIIVDVTTGRVIRANLRNIPSNQLEHSVLFSVWPLMNNIANIAQHTLRSAVASCCTLISCPPIKKAIHDITRRCKVNVEPI